MKFARFGCQDLKATAPIYRGLAWVIMGEYKPFGEGTAINQVQINLYVFTRPHLDITSANLASPLRQL
jgi:hypothetical protein